MSLNENATAGHQETQLPYARYFVQRAYPRLEKTVLTGFLSEGLIHTGAKPWFWQQNRRLPIGVIVSRIEWQSYSKQSFEGPGPVDLIVDGIGPDTIAPGNCLIISSQMPTFPRRFGIKLFGNCQEGRVVIKLHGLEFSATLKNHPLGFAKVVSTRGYPLIRGDKVIIESGEGETLTEGIVTDTELPKTIHSQPPENIRQYIEWCRKHNPPNSVFGWSMRLGIPTSDVQFLIGVEEKKVTSPSKLAEKIFANKWIAYITPSENKEVKDLVSDGIVIHLKDQHYLHHAHLTEFLKWTETHFEDSWFLDLDTLRKYFGVSKTAFMNILKYCESKNLLAPGKKGWQPVKVRKSSVPTADPPKGGSGRGPRTGRPQRRH